jgi:hypothetical protein
MCVCACARACVCACVCVCVCVCRQEVNPRFACNIRCREVGSKFYVFIEADGYV